MPETLRVTFEAANAVVTDDMFDEMALAIAKYALAGDDRMTSRIKLEAAMTIMRATSVEDHPDPALLLTHLSRSDADTAIEILRRNGLIH